ncbi:F-box/WD repeat-containing protein 2 [Penaeus vannamei]|uniref:F-box/WD repeat-containing protein 2 n=1 Tax=Penaeus vannamei TaxID=6689 RepID=UPI00387F8764
MDKLISELVHLEVAEQQKVLSALVTPLSPEKQLSLLLPAVSRASGYVKWRLAVTLAWQDTPDLLELLPAELQVMVLQYLDGPSLLTACQVCQGWNRVLMNHGQLWLKKCQQLGVNMDLLSQGTNWHEVYVSSLRQLTSLKNGTAFVERFMQLQNCNKAVKAVDYQDGYLCTVSEEDYVNIWQLDLNIPILTFPVERAVSYIKFRPKQLLVCGHFVGILTSWDLSAMDKQSSVVYSGVNNHSSEYQLLRCKFKMHAGPVFCCDFSNELDLLISGGADDCINLWCLSSGLKVKSLPHQEHWVLRVILMPVITHSQQHCVISMTRDCVNKLTWDAHCSESSGTADVGSRKMGSIDQIQSKMCVRLNEGNHNFFTPGLHCSQKYIGLIKQDIDEKHACLCVYDIENFDLKYNITLNFKVKKLLALGNRYALLLTVGCVLYSSTLMVVDIVTGESIGSHTIPHSKMTTPDGAQLMVGDVEWLDGLRGQVCPSSATPAVKEDEGGEGRAAEEQYGVREDLGNLGLDARIQQLNISSAPEKSSLTLERPSRLVLAAGVQSEPGSLFTLWWSYSRATTKCKKE